jgi:hypothetical protein
MAEEATAPDDDVKVDVARVDCDRPVLVVAVAVAAAGAVVGTGGSGVGGGVSPAKRDGDRVESAVPEEGVFVVADVDVDEPAAAAYVCDAVGTRCCVERPDEKWANETGRLPCVGERPGDTGADGERGNRDPPGGGGEVGLNCWACCVGSPAMRRGPVLEAAPRWDVCGDDGDEEDEGVNGCAEATAGKADGAVAVRAGVMAAAPGTALGCIDVGALRCSGTWSAA